MVLPSDSYDEVEGFDRVVSNKLPTSTCDAVANFTYTQCSSVHKNSRPFGRIFLYLYICHHCADARAYMEELLPSTSQKRLVCVFVPMRQREHHIVVTLPVGFLDEFFFGWR